jgi:hypothetical protein
VAWPPDAARRPHFYIRLAAIGVGFASVFASMAWEAGGIAI